MQPVPTPHVLDEQRVLDNDRGDFLADHEARAAMYKKGFLEANSYAQQLWNTLGAARSYLWESLPSDPRSPGPHPRLSAAPTSPDDDEGWTRWIDAYAGVTSVLCGPHGASGFGAGEARETARFRRDAPNVKVAAAVNLTGAVRAEDDVTTNDEATAQVSAPRPDDGSQTRPGDTPSSTLRTVALMVVAAAVGRWLPSRRNKAAA